MGRFLETGSRIADNRFVFDAQIDPLNVLRRLSKYISKNVPSVSWSHCTASNDSKTCTKRFRGSGDWTLRNFGEVLYFGLKPSTALTFLNGEPFHKTHFSNTEDVWRDDTNSSNFCAIKLQVISASHKNKQTQNRRYITISAQADLLLPLTSSVFIANEYCCTSQPKVLKDVSRDNLTFLGLPNSSVHSLFRSDYKANMERALQESLRSLLDDFFRLDTSRLVWERLSRKTSNLRLADFMAVQNTAFSTLDLLKDYSGITSNFRHSPASFTSNVMQKWDLCPLCISHSSNGIPLIAVDSWLHGVSGICKKMSKSVLSGIGMYYDFCTKAPQRVATVSTTTQHQHARQPPNLPQHTHYLDSDGRQRQQLMSAYSTSTLTPPLSDFNSQTTNQCKCPLSFKINIFIYSTGFEDSALLADCRRCHRRATRTLTPYIPPLRTCMYCCTSGATSSAYQNGCNLLTPPNHRRTISSVCLTQRHLFAYLRVSAHLVEQHNDALSVSSRASVSTTENISQSHQTNPSFSPRLNTLKSLKLSPNNTMRFYNPILPFTPSTHLKVIHPIHPVNLRVSGAKQISSPVGAWKIGLATENAGLSSSAWKCSVDVFTIYSNLPIEKSGEALKSEGNKRQFDSPLVCMFVTQIIKSLQHGDE